MTRSRRQGSWHAIVVCLILNTLATPPAEAADAPCVTDIGGAARPGFYNMSGHQSCGGEANLQGEHDPGVGNRTEVIDCGPHVSQQVVHGGVASPCQQVALECEGATPGPRGVPTTNVGTFEVLDGGALHIVSSACNAVAVPAVPAVSPVVVAQEIARRVPGPGVGVAPPGGVSLVNIQTLLWVDSPASVELGTVRLVGQLVRLRVQLAQVAWDFGDGHSENTGTAGKAYTTADPCRTKLCPDYFGHVYTRHGVYTVSARVSWTGEFQVGGGAWQQIPNLVTGPARTTGVHIYQAHGELVPDPTG